MVLSRRFESDRDELSHTVYTRPSLTFAEGSYLYVRTAAKTVKVHRISGVRSDADDTKQYDTRSARNPFLNEYHTCLPPVVIHRRRIGCTREGLCETPSGSDQTQRGKMHKREVLGVYLSVFLQRDWVSSMQTVTVSETTLKNRMQCYREISRNFELKKIVSTPS